MYFLTEFSLIKTKLIFQHDQKEQDTRKLHRNISIALIRI